MIKNNITAVWVKKAVPTKEWNTYYSQISSYSFLEEIKDKKNPQVIVGFLAANNVPDNCYPCDNYEIAKIDKSRRETNTRPFPLTGEND